MASPLQNLGGPGKSLTAEPPDATELEYQFRAGDAAYFPPNTNGVWTIRERLRKTYIVWR